MKHGMHIYNEKIMKSENERQITNRIAGKLGIAKITLAAVEAEGSVISTRAIVRVSARIVFTSLCLFTALCYSRGTINRANLCFTRSLF